MDFTMQVVFLKERRVYDGSIFKLEEHTSRLFYSAERMGMTIPYTVKKKLMMPVIKLFQFKM
jgi:hypothetical protein